MNNLRVSHHCFSFQSMDSAPHGRGESTALEEVVHETCSFDWDAVMQEPGDEVLHRSRIALNFPDDMDAAWQKIFPSRSRDDALSSIGGKDEREEIKSLLGTKPGTKQARVGIKRVTNINGRKVTYADREAYTAAFRDLQSANPGVSMVREFAREHRLHRQTLLDWLSAHPGNRPSVLELACQGQEREFQSLSSVVTRTNWLERGSLSLPFQFQLKAFILKGVEAVRKATGTGNSHSLWSQLFPQAGGKKFSKVIEGIGSSSSTRRKTALETKELVVEFLELKATSTKLTQAAFAKEQGIPVRTFKDQVQKFKRARRSSQLAG